MISYNLERFLSAQESSYQAAFAEIRSGRKRGHWIWYIFPQIQGLGFSSTSQFYAIANLDEAEQFLNHQLLGSRLVAISRVLLNLPSNDATRILGTPDDMKLRSSMTLFAAVPGADPVFQLVLDKFFNGIGDKRTTEILQNPH